VYGPIVVLVHIPSAKAVEEVDLGKILLRLLARKSFKVRQEVLISSLFLATVVVRNLRFCFWVCIKVFWMSMGAATGLKSIDIGPVDVVINH
jgi:hypothetical protein